MKIQKQPKGSKTCGQHAVAMIIDRPADYVISLFETVVGKHTINGTRTKEVAAVLRYLQYNPNDKLTRFKHQKELPELCILKLLYERNMLVKGVEQPVTLGHWVVYNNGYIYCSGNIGIMKYCKQTFIDCNIRCSSYLKIN